MSVERLVFAESLLGFFYYGFFSSGFVVRLLDTAALLEDEFEGVLFAADAGWVLVAGNGVTGSVPCLGCTVVELFLLEVCLI